MSVIVSSTDSALRERARLRQQILDLSAGTPEHSTFEQLTLALFRYQAAHNPLYATYLRHRSVRPGAVTELTQIPFLPVGFFRNHAVLTEPLPNAVAPADRLTFASSGTTATATSHHYVPDPDLYEIVSIRLFERAYGPLANVPILALLPSYLERNNSSLVYMVRQFMQRSGSPDSGFFLNNHAELTGRLRRLCAESPNRKILLIGVTFGLLDWAESDDDLTFLGQNPTLIVMETGGMKGRRKELLREEVHALLTNRLGVPAVHSEYGMTELLSQAYSSGAGVFKPSATLRVLLRDVNDPFAICLEEASGSVQTGFGLTRERQTGGINVIDLANLDSCAFIETQDLGQYVGTDGRFRVVGRFDNADVRGCNLLVV